MVAAAFTHYDTRSGDPQLHDHVVVWNRAKSVSDGEWRTLDSRGLFKSVVTISEIHQGVLADMLTQALGVGWESGDDEEGDAQARDRPEYRRPSYAEFAQRRDMIEELAGHLLESRSSRSMAGNRPRSRRCVSTSRRTWQHARTSSIAAWPPCPPSGGNGPCHTSACGPKRG